jgi:hypothetical protein
MTPQGLSLEKGMFSRDRTTSQITGCRSIKEAAEERVATCYSFRSWCFQNPIEPPPQIEVHEMEEHETRRKIIREWMKLPKDKRRTEEHVAAFAKMAVQQNEFTRSRRDPYQKVIGWLLPRVDHDGG